MFGELFALAFNNLLRARARLIMTAGGVLVGTAAVVLLIALTIGLQQAAEAGIGSSSALTELQVYNYGGRPMSESEEPEVRPMLNNEAIRAFYQIPGVAAVVPTIYLQTGGGFVVGNYMGYASIQGIDPALLPYLQLTLDAGEAAMNPDEMVCGAAVGTGFYDTKSDNWDPVTVDLMAQPLKMEMSGLGGTKKVNLTVRGVIAAGGSFDYVCFMPIKQIIEWNEWSTGSKIDWKTFQYDNVMVRTAGREFTNDVSNAIRKMGFTTGGMGDFLNQLNGFFSTMRLMLGGVGGVALLVAAFGVANTMTMAILERTREIGLMKAIGASDSHILTIFLLEAGMVGLTGGTAGIGVAILLQQAINQAIANAPVQEGGISFLPIDPSMLKGELVVIPPELMLFALGLALLVGMGAGLYPSLRAARLQPVIALKTD